MTTLPDIARRLVEEPALVPPPALDDLRRRNSRRSRRGLTTLGIATVVVAVLGAAVVMSSLEDRTAGRRRVNAGPTPSSSSPAPVRPPLETETGPPPLQPHPVSLEVTPSILDPEGGTATSLTLRNESDSEVARLCGASLLRLDRWDTGGWRPLGYGFTTLQALDPSRTDTDQCFTQGIVAPHSARPVAGPVPSPALEPGWYRWFEDLPGGRRTGMTYHPVEGRFRVEAPGRPPVPAPGSHTVWLAGGERLNGLAATDAAEAYVVDGDRLAVTWATECNQPGAAVIFDLRTDRVEVQVLAGSFLVVDCGGELSRPWSTVVDLPEPLAGRSLVVVGPSANRIAVEVVSRSDAEPDLSGGAPASLRAWPQRTSQRVLGFHWHGTTCDRVLSVELIDLGDRLFPRAAVTEDECSGEPSGLGNADGTIAVPEELRDLPIVGAP